MILDYVLKFHLQDCLDILSKKNELGYYFIVIDFLKLFETYPDVGDKVLCSPVESLPYCNKDIVKAQQQILEHADHKDKVLKLDYCCLKRNVHARFYGLPVCPELQRTIFPKNVDLGCFLKVTGTVVRVTQSKMLEYQRKYVCVKCKFETNVEAEFENRYVLKAPKKCGNTEHRCKCATFTQINLVSQEHCKDYQEIKIQEQVNKLNVGTIPGSMWVVLENDLVDTCKPGDDVNICGTVRRRWRPSIQCKKSEVELVLQANHIEVCNAQRSQIISAAPDIKECFNEFWVKYDACPLKGRDCILGSVCPQVYGLHLVKLALLLTIITGSSQVQENESIKTSSQDERNTTRIRGQCHLLLVGDPGTGKSQLLKAAVELTPRSVFTSGAGSTRAGLTCSALREEGEWQLEAGALVLSDGGVCCIDEISQLREHDRTAIHEAMEQQTISIAKAGIVCKLNTRCAVVAACNPKGHYETDQPLGVNVSLGTPLLSRFDLIFILLDSKNKVWDKLVSSYILFGGSHSADTSKKWSVEKLQMYIGLVGPKSTHMTKSANTILQAYYMTQRKSECRDPSRTTVRMLDSLFRLSQAHCRLMYRTTILPVDAIVAVSLMDLSMQDCTLNDTVDALHSTFQKYPDYDYLCTAKKLLTKLNLYEIWNDELLRYAKLLQVDHKTLENEIERNSTKLFAKFDDVTDDNIPLSASLVTSSYFNNKKDKQPDDLGFIDDKAGEENSIKKNINDKLAETLKKHAALNKTDIKPVVTKQTKKRKRNEIVVDTKALKKRTTKAKYKKENILTDSEDDECNENEALNAVPSVNDIFNNLGIDFKYCAPENEFEVESSQQISFNLTTEVEGMNMKKSEHFKHVEKEVSDFSKKENNDFKEENNDFSKKENNDFNKVENNDLNKKETCDINKGKTYDLNESTKIISKLEQFAFKENHDLDKFYKEKNNQNKNEFTENEHSIFKLSELKNTCNDKIKKQSASSSQLSMFESSDCDDLDFDV